VRSIFAQPSAEEVWAQHDRVALQLQDRFPAAAELLTTAADDLLAFTAFPSEHWRQIWSNNPLERLHRGSAGVPTSSASFPIELP
jgi:putative transposase